MAYKVHVSYNQSTEIESIRLEFLIELDSLRLEILVS